MPEATAGYGGSRASPVLATGLSGPSPTLCRLITGLRGLVAGVCASIPEGPCFGHRGGYSAQSVHNDHSMHAPVREDLFTKSDCAVSALQAGWYQ